MRISKVLLNNFVTHLCENFDGELVYEPSSRTYLVIRKNAPHGHDPNTCYTWLDHIRPAICSYERDRYIMYEFDLSMLFACRRKAVSSSRRDLIAKDRVSRFLDSLDAELEREKQFNCFRLTFKDTTLYLYGQIKPCSKFKEQVIEPKLKRAQERLMRDPALERIKLIREPAGNFPQILKQKLTNSYAFFFFFFYNVDSIDSRNSAHLSVQALRLPKSSRVSIGLLRCQLIYEDIAAKFMPAYRCEPFSDTQMHLAEDLTGQDGADLGKAVLFVNLKAETSEWRNKFQKELYKYFDAHFANSLVQIPDEMLNDLDAMNVLKVSLRDLNRASMHEFCFQLELLGGQWEKYAIRCVGLRESYFSRLADLNRLFVKFIRIIRDKANKVVRFKISKKPVEKPSVRIKQFVYRIEADKTLHRALMDIPLVQADFKRDLEKRCDSDLTLNKVFIIINFAFTLAPWN